ncbi:MAG: NAD(P)/FAD-dependent oxidoreductase [Gloeomargarita sp. GMQP_bins_120]
MQSLGQRFQPRDVLAWFVAEGVTLTTVADGRVFPTSDHSEAICPTGSVQVQTRGPV